MIRSFIPVAVVAALSGVASAAAGPRALAPSMGGLWEVGERADGHGAKRVCLSNVQTLMRWEHRGAQCRQKLLSEGERGAVVDYNCGAAGFGHSRLTILTPRTLKVETQGISNNFPFQYTVHARRLGACPPR